PPPPSRTTVTKASSMPAAFVASPSGPPAPSVVAPLPFFPDVLVLLLRAREETLGRPDQARERLQGLLGRLQQHDHVGLHSGNELGGVDLEDPGTIDDQLLADGVRHGSRRSDIHHATSSPGPDEPPSRPGARKKHDGCR